MTYPMHLIAGQVPPCRVFLNRIEQCGVVEAHLVENWIIQFRYDDAGHPIVDNDEILTEKVFGPVTVEWIEE